MSRPVVAVVAGKTRAKHGPWDEVVELVPVELIDRLQEQGCLVVVLPSMARNRGEWAGLDIAGLAGIVIYSAEDGAAAADDLFKASADDRPLPVLHVSGDGSLDERTFAMFASQVSEA